MVGKGMELAIYDRDVSEAKLIGANKDYIEGEIPHIWSLMRGSAREVIEHGDVVVVGNATGEIRCAWRAGVCRQDDHRPGSAVREQAGAGYAVRRNLLVRHMH